MKKRVVITGASGNVGTALLRKLAIDTDYEVHGIVRRMPPPTDVYARARWHELDIAVRQQQVSAATCFPAICTHGGCVCCQ